MRIQRMLLGMSLMAALAVGGFQTAAAGGGEKKQERMGKKVGEAVSKKVDYLNRLALFDAGQIEMGRLAMKQSTNPEVRQLAQQLVNNHQQQLDSLQAYADGEAIKLAMVDLSQEGLGVGGAGMAGQEAAAQKMEEMSQKYGKEYTRDVDAFAKKRNELASKSGADFDKTFLSDVKKSQERGAKMVKQGISEYRDDPALASLLGQTHGVLEQNIQSVDSVWKAVK
ncbi:MAG: DUF4142 domain-containing protein [Myxococcaceae bacterium]|nr:DUF4142 domain-containing protein [Myxococcaceae bacterium]MCI0671206.1 DUF4142 domain-containing protein [Myxococcaceae bacterium]